MLYSRLGAWIRVRTIASDLVGAHLKAGTVGLWLPIRVNMQPAVWRAELTQLRAIIPDENAIQRIWRVQSSIRFGERRSVRAQDPPARIGD